MNYRQFSLVVLRLTNLIHLHVLDSVQDLPFGISKSLRKREKRTYLMTRIASISCMTPILHLEARSPPEARSMTIKYLSSIRVPTKIDIPVYRLKVLKKRNDILVSEIPNHINLVPSDIRRVPDGTLLDDSTH
jgi:hypothetical protein